MNKKTALSIAATVIFSTSVASANDLYFGFSGWNTKGDFSELKKNGIKMNAVKAALKHCHSAGHKECAIEGIELHYTNERFYDKNLKQKRYSTKYNAYAKGLNKLNLPDRTQGELHTAESTWTNSTQFNYLSSMGVEFRALEKALNLCYQSGATYCAIKEVEELEYNTPTYDSVKDQYTYKTRARATVKGYKLP